MPRTSQRGISSEKRVWSALLRPRLDRVQNETGRIQVDRINEGRIIPWDPPHHFPGRFRKMPAFPTAAPQ